MKITVETIDAKVKAAADARAELEKAKEQAFKEKQELTRKAEAAAEDGNVDLYYQYTQDAGRVDAAAHVREVQLRKKDQPVTEPEVTAAWADFVAGYNKNLAAGLVRLEKAKDALLSEYEALVDLQGDALEIRERLAGYVDQKALESSFPMEYIPAKNGLDIGGVKNYFGSDPFVCFFLAYRSLGNPTLEDPTLGRVNSIVHRHQARKK